MNGFTLKCIALGTMLIDHIGAAFFPQYMWLRMIGRIAFPIYCFLLVEGYSHTKNVKKYLGRMFVFALISELPFRLLFYGSIQYYRSINVFFTLFLGLLAMYVCDRMAARWYSYPMIGWSAFVVAGAVAVWLKTDYDYHGIALIFIFYQIKQSKVLQTGLCALVFGMMSRIQMYAMFALVPVFLYNGKRGPNPKILSRIFYLFYPLHLLILYGIKRIM